VIRLPTAQFFDQIDGVEAYTVVFTRSLEPLRWISSNYDVCAQWWSFWGSWRWV